MLQNGSKWLLLPLLQWLLVKCYCIAVACIAQGLCTCSHWSIAIFPEISGNFLLICNFRKIYKDVLSYREPRDADITVNESSRVRVAPICCHHRWTLLLNVVEPDPPGDESSTIACLLLLQPLQLQERWSVVFVGLLLRLLVRLLLVFNYGSAIDVWSSQPSSTSTYKLFLLWQFWIVATINFARFV